MVLETAKPDYGIGVVESHLELLRCRTGSWQEAIEVDKEAQKQASCKDQEGDLK